MKPREMIFSWKNKFVCTVHSHQTSSDTFFSPSFVPCLPWVLMQDKTGMPSTYNSTYISTSVRISAQSRFVTTYQSWIRSSQQFRQIEKTSWLIFFCYATRTFFHVQYWMSEPRFTFVYIGLSNISKLWSTNCQYREIWLLGDWEGITKLVIAFLTV